MRFKFGYVTLQVTGYKPAKFINIAARRGLFFKNIRFIEERKIEVDVDLKSFRKIRPVAYKSRCRMKILRKKGSAFFLRKCIDRKIFFIEGLCSFAAVIILSMMVGSIEVNAPVTVSTKKILDLIEANGVHTGAFRFNIDDEQLTKKIVMEFDEIAWAEVRFRGMTLQVDVAEAIKKPHIVPYTEPCDIVAAKDGVIHSMDVKNGTILVETGNTVTKGDIIVSGTMIPKFDENGAYQVHAHGEILASTWYTAEQIVNTMEVERKRTGEFFENRSIKIMGLNINLFNRKNKYEAFDMLVEKNKVVLWDLIKLPIVFTKETYFEYDENIINIDGNKAMENAKEAAYVRCLEQISDNAEIIDVKFSTKTVQNDGICVTVIVECIEDIGLEMKIE